MVCPVSTFVRADNLLLFSGELGPTLIDLSNAVKLEDVAFQLGSWSTEWVTTALQTITHKHRNFRQISIHIRPDLISLYAEPDLLWLLLGEMDHEPLGLDRFLIQFWESRSIQPKVICATRTGSVQEARYCLDYLLPEIVARGRGEIVIDTFGHWARPNDGSILTIVTSC